MTASEYQITSNGRLFRVERWCSHLDGWEVVGTPVTSMKDAQAWREQQHDYAPQRWMPVEEHMAQAQFSPTTESIIAALKATVADLQKLVLELSHGA